MKPEDESAESSRQQSIVLDARSQNLHQLDENTTRLEDPNAATRPQRPGKRPKGKLKKAGDRKKPRERRRYRRIATREVRARIKRTGLMRIGPSGVYKPCRVDNLSQGGLGVVSARFVKPGKRIKLEISLPDGTLTEAYGVICSAYPHGIAFRHHIEIYDMPKAVRDWVVRSQASVPRDEPSLSTDLTVELPTPQRTHKKDEEEYLPDSLSQL